MAHLVVGLGNPGREYAQTRHNVGFMVIDQLARRSSIDVARKRGGATYGQGSIDGHAVVLAKPQTYMNDSGIAVRGLLNWFKLAPSDVIVVYDEMDLPLGKLRLRARGSSGGHRGAQSVIQHVATPEFARVRIGVGRPEGGAIGHVLGRFSRDEQVAAARAVERAAEAVRAIMARGIAAAMNEFNADPVPDTETDAT